MGNDKLPATGEEAGRAEGDLIKAAQDLDARCEDEDGYDHGLIWPERQAVRDALAAARQPTDVNEKARRAAEQIAPFLDRWRVNMKVLTREVAEIIAEEFAAPEDRGSEK